jgi:GNAT superfamily N-acetyltransferase
MALTPGQNGARLRLIDADEAERLLPVFAELLVDAVRGGAGVNFMADVTVAATTDYWRRQIAAFRGGDRIWLIAEADGAVAGMVMCVFAPQPNQPYRADISKMLVHSRFRRRGIGADLMRGIEAAARDAGKVLLVLDTVTGSAGDRLYARMGWTPFGIVPGFAYLPEGTPEAATFYYKQLAPIPAWRG